MNKLLGSYKEIFLISIGWWLFWLTGQTIVLHRIGLSWGDAFFEGVCTVLVLALMGFIIINIFRYYSQITKNFYLVAADILVLTAATGKILYFTFEKMNEGDAFYMENILPYMPLRGIFYFLMITLLTVVCWFRTHEQEQRSMKQREEEAETLMRDAELAKLRQQLQPHFLFNSLNSISSLAGSRPEEARKMIQQLSDFLRGTLKKDDQQLVPLEEEFRHLNLYLEIEKVRFGHRLNTEMMHDERTAMMKLPSLLLQPIVENAVKFGLYDTTEAITIRIHASSENNFLVIIVENPFDATTSKPRQGTGFGLTSVQRRLYLLFARNDLLEIKTKDNTFITTVKIPQVK